MCETKPTKKVLICDLDNTLYDWVGYFVPAFYAMIDKAVELLKCDREQLLDDCREVHQRHHDSEHPFAILESRTVRDRFSGWDRIAIMRELDPALHAFNSMRKRRLSLHSGVRATLELLHARGVRLIAHTDSQLFGVVDRLMRLKMETVFARIYCRERSMQAHPTPEKGNAWLERFPMKRVRELSRHQMKPDPMVIYEICELEGVEADEVAYVGDSIARDILMAQKAGVFGIWAKYGAHLDSIDYERLVRITHWTSKDVERERMLKKEAERIQPDFVAEESFEEILTVLLPGTGVCEEKKSRDS